jgi:predicted MFS family arabinose efflux permease
MSALRAAVGFVTFHLGFALKRSGEPLWVFGLVLVANGLGGILGTLVSPALRRRISEYGMLAIAFTIPAVVAFVASLRFHPVSVVLVTLGLGIAVATGRRAFDNVVQERAPQGARGAAYAGLDTRHELGWVSGALAAVLARALAGADVDFDEVRSAVGKILGHGHTALGDP